MQASDITKPSTPMQKVIAVAIILGTLFIGAKVVNAFLPEIIEAMKNIYIFLGFGIPLAFITLYAILNPFMVWSSIITLQVKLRNLMIKMDPLSVMDRYVDFLTNKLRKLNKSIDVLLGKKQKGEREMETLKESYKSHMELAAAAYKQGKQSIAGTEGLKAQTDKGRMDRLKPLLDRTYTSLELMQNLAEASSTTIDRLTYQIDSKRKEFELNKEIFKGLKSAEDFINSDNEAARAYGQSIKELEEQTTQYIGYIDGFEKRSKTLTDSIAVEKQANIDAGLTELQNYMNANNLPLTVGVDLNAQVPVGQPVRQKFFNKS